MMMRWIFCLLVPIFAAAVQVGLGKVDITPKVGTPSAGYADRKGGMEGIHDPLLAIALYLDTGEKKIAICSVDHLGFTYEMVQAVTSKVQQEPNLADCEVYIASSHTHSGAGAYLNIPGLGEMLAGPYDATVVEEVVDKTANVIIEASRETVCAKIGVGYGKATGLSHYRALWPEGVTPLDDITVIKLTHLDDTPLALLFNYPLHPTILKAKNRFFSADFVGYTRNHLQTLLGNDLQPIYVNGAQGDIVPKVLNEQDFAACEMIGHSLADVVKKIWDATKTDEALSIRTERQSYAFKPAQNPFGMSLPVDLYESEINALVFNVLNEKHAFLTMPGELSCLYEKRFQEKGEELGFTHVSIWGLTNDAHGYIIVLEAWEHKTTESILSFGGKYYGDRIQAMSFSLLEALCK